MDIGQYVRSLVSVLCPTQLTHILSVPPLLTDSLQSEFLVREGQSSIIFPCSGTGDPEPTLNWLHGSFVLPLGNKQVVPPCLIFSLPPSHIRTHTQRILPDGSLEIFQLVPEDSGEYMCRLANVAGEQYHTVNLIVRGEDWLRNVCV